jgi:DNA mismatch repair protein MutL
MASIHILPPEAARLIAAGEVIDRPASALRELLDNSIDAGATEISVRIEEGGVRLIRVADDGLGMEREDLELAALPHATSKIRGADDLLRVRSLGFRGEALASIAAVAGLEIVSMTSEARSAFRLRSSPGSTKTIEACSGRKGTTVVVSDLFKDFPARRQFLKRSQAEASLCRQVFEDKAVAHPGIRFSFESGSSAPLVLPAGDLVSRIASFYPDIPAGFLHQIHFAADHFEGSVVVAGPSIARSDRRYMQVFVNRRRVQDWSLLQCLDYAFSGYLPGGLHPFALLFLEIDPLFADFNIHPAKKEVRLKDPDSPRRAVIRAIQDFLGDLTRKEPAQAASETGIELDLHGFGGDDERNHPPLMEGAPQRQSPYGTCRGFPGVRPVSSSRSSDSKPSWKDFDELRERSAKGLGPSLPGPKPASGFRYIGRALGPFLLFELGDELWFLDQHAAHERLLFDEYMAKPPPVQELLVPEKITIENESEAALIAESIETLNSGGFRIERDGEDWLVIAAPAPLAKGASQALRELALASGDIRGPGSALRAAAALAACRTAVKDGDELDAAAAESLIAAALELSEPRCPHGRPIWTRITRDQLYALVRRTL